MAGELKHTHYSPYEAPRQVPGTLLDCTPEYPEFHKVEGSELWADYSYQPRLGPESATGIGDELPRLLIAYLKYRSEDVWFRIVDVVRDEDYTYRVSITNRTGYNGDGPDWHTEEWGIHGDGQWHGIPKNPHPGYEHMPPWCANCGY